MASILLANPASGLYLPTFSVRSGQGCATRPPAVMVTLSSPPTHSKGAMHGTQFRFVLE
ncbi:MAG: hypothetical protein ABSD67_02045 [Terracidiphilus sp.]